MIVQCTENEQLPIGRCNFSSLHYITLENYL